jgi:hypothetical protein
MVALCNTNFNRYFEVNMNGLIEFLKNIYRKLSNTRPSSEPVIPEVYQDLDDNPDFSGSDPQNYPSGHHEINSGIGLILPEISREVDFKKPTTLSDEGIVSSSVSTRETETGIERQVIRPILIAACGKAIQESEIGIKCSICGKYDCREHSFLCHACGRSLCIHHVKFFRNDAGNNIPYCDKHYRESVFNKNMWK